MTIVVTGATGNVGRPLVAQLAKTGVEVRAVARHPERAAFPAGVAVMNSTVLALPGASAVFLDPRALGDELPVVTEMAWWTGVPRLVTLSALNANEHSSEAEQLTMGSGMEWVSLRATNCATDFACMWSAQIRAGDVVVGPRAGACSAPIAERDIAAVAGRAMLTDQFVDQRIPLTGPQVHTHEELVEIIGSVLDRRLRYQEVPLHGIREHFSDIGLSAQCADSYTELLAATVDQPPAVTSDVENVLGRPAQSFAEWAANHRSLFTEYQELNVGLVPATT